MSTDVAERQKLSAELQEKVLLGGDLSKLTTPERLAYYGHLCESLGLNPLTRPFEYLTLNGKMVLYARKDCTEQLRNNRNISVTIVSREVVEGVYVVTARAEVMRAMSDGTRVEGRCDESIGAVPIDGVKGNDRANAMMKAETKAKRRVTLAICGLGLTDESEIETIPGARVFHNIPQVRSRDEATMVQAGENDKRQADGAGADHSPPPHQQASDAPAAQASQEIADFAMSDADWTAAITKIDGNDQWADLKQQVKLMEGIKDLRRIGTARRGEFLAKLITFASKQGVCIEI